MVRSIIIGLLVVGMAITSYWGYTSYQAKNNMMTHIENNYQRAFHNLVYHIDLLHDKMGTSFVMNTSNRLSPQFVDIWRLTSVAQSDVSQLPLGLLPFQHTAQFLAELHDFTYDTAIRNLDDDPLTDAELETLEKYYEHAKVIKDELRQAQYMTLNNQLRWTDIELALMDGQMESDNDVLDGFQSIEDGTSEFSDSLTDNPFALENDPEHMYESVKGKKYDANDMATKAVEMFSLDSDENVTVTQSLDGADIANYNVSYADNEKEIFMDMTAFGAYPVTFIVNRKIGEAKKSLHDGQVAAEEYLNDIGYSQMGIVESEQYDNIGVYTFAYVADDVYILPDTIGLKVALDTGDVIGLHAREYLKNHHDRMLDKPTISEAEAKRQVHDNIDIQESKLVLYANKGEEILAYMFLGTSGNDTYRIFVNAEDGTEEKVEKLSEAETNFELL